MHEPHRRVCPKHGAYRTTWSLWHCPRKLRVYMFLGVPPIEIDCPGETWRADDPPGLLERLWRKLMVWTREDGDA